MGGTMQAIVDFLVDERCHACRGAVRPRTGAASPDDVHPFETPVRIGVGSVSLATRLFCPACALRTQPWRDPVVVGSGGPATDADPLTVYPAFVTDENVLTVIHLLKFSRRDVLAPWLARAMAVGLPLRAVADARVPTVLVPVPMDRASRRRRGFNQAERIAVALGRAWNLPVARRALDKTHRTAAQSSLGRDARLRNLAGAVRSGSDPVRGMAVVLIDDLVTTGATAAACAGPLLAAGAVSMSVASAGYRPAVASPRPPFCNLDNDFHGEI